MISVQIDQPALDALRQRLSTLPPRLVAQVQQELRPLLYQSLRNIVPKYFAGSAAKGASSRNLLTSRSGSLLNSVLNSIQITDAGVALNVAIGSTLPYAAIHEYGGYAGRPGPFKKKNGRRPYLPARPYLHPALSDLQQILPDLVEQAVRQAKEVL